jgi:hypothetical protein
VRRGYIATAPAAPRWPRRAGGAPFHIGASHDRAVTDEAEDRAVAFIEKLGGQVERDPRLPGMPVVAVAVFGTKMTDAGLKALAPLKELRRLRLGLTEVTDAGLKELAALTQLRSRSLGGTQVTGAGLADVRKAVPRCLISR